MKAYDELVKRYLVTVPNKAYTFHVSPHTQQLLEAGMSLARFDFSWGSRDYHSLTLKVSPSAFVSSPFS